MRPHIRHQRSWDAQLQRPRLGPAQLNFTEGSTERLLSPEDSDEAVEEPYVVSCTKRLIQSWIARTGSPCDGSSVQLKPRHDSSR